MLSKEEQVLYDSYANWMKSKGAKFDKVELKWFHTDYRGIVATDVILKNEIIMYIPDAAIISLQVAKQAPIGKKLEMNEGSLIYPNNSTLSSYVLWEMSNPYSPWTFFLKALPKSVSSFPVFYTPNELKLLEGSSFVQSVEELREDMKHDYKEICRCAPEFKKVASVKDFMRVRVLINSRIFGTVINGEESDAIVPYADMFNYKHKNKMTSWVYSNDLKGFVVKAREVINKGEEVFVFYGNKANYNFLQFYGFVLEDNEYDEVILTIDFFESDPLRSTKESLLEVIKVPMKLRLRHTTTNSKYYRAISFLRYVTYNGTKEELRKVNILYNYYIDLSTLCYATNG